MRLVDQWSAIEDDLPAEWAEARLALSADDPARAGRAATVLGPLNPGREGDRLRFSAVRRGPGFGPDHVRRLLRRLDRDGVRATLELVEARESAPAAPARRTALADEWTLRLESLPADWSDLLCELDLESSDQLDRAALLLSPLNPARPGEQATLQFRVARRFGYGASPEMTGRCLSRLDEEGIRGSVAILRALSDTRPVATQGPVWYVGGRAV